jgi:folate-dependent phosphoribosylglycinamide formyltransferase PurN
MNPRIVLLTSDQPVARVLADRLANTTGLTLIVQQVDTGARPYSKWSNRVRSVVGDRMVDRLMHRVRLTPEMRRLLAFEERLANKADHYFMESASTQGLRAEWPEVERVETTDLNTAETIQRIRDARPDVLVVYGTKILKAPLLAVPTKGTLNAHTSLLPAYRGTRSEFWQCLNNDPTSAGITIHLVDTGVDTGQILYQKPAETGWPTDPFHLRALNNLMVVEHYPWVIEHFVQGDLRPTVQPQSEGHTYRLREHTREKRLELMRRLEKELGTD